MGQWQKSVHNKDNKIYIKICAKFLETVCICIGFILFWTTIFKNFFYLITLKIKPTEGITSLYFEYM